MNTKKEEQQQQQKRDSDLCGGTRDFRTNNICSTGKIGDAMFRTFIVFEEINKNRLCSAVEQSFKVTKL
jgi:hypothetical protein